MKTTVTAFALAMLWTVVILGVGVSTGWVTLTARVSLIADPGAFLYRHLQMSIVPFSLLLLAYCILIARVRNLLREKDTTVARLAYYDRLLNATISTFFGVGVIWTAVGMESALVGAVDGITGGDAAVVIGPRDLLERLVNGGLLLALSTTIFGGICGYLLRLLKIVLLGEQWDICMLREADGHEETGVA